jgi:hypothetical protein
VTANHVKLSGRTAESREIAAKLRARIGVCTRSIDASATKIKVAVNVANQNKEKEAKRVAAIKEAEKQEALFKKYDADGDGLLDADEIVEYVKGEYDFELPEEKN